MFADAIFTIAELLPNNGMKGDFDNAIADFTQAIKLDLQTLLLSTTTEGLPTVTKLEFGNKSINDFAQAIRLTPLKPPKHTVSVARFMTSKVILTMPLMILPHAIKLDSNMIDYYNRRRYLYRKKVKLTTPLMILPKQ